MDSFPATAFPFGPLPLATVAALLDAQCKNAATLTSAHRVLVDGLTTLAQQQGALFRTTVDDCSRATGEVLASASFEERTTRQAEAARQVCVSTFDRLRALSDITVRTNVAALDILNARVAEAFDDLAALLSPAAAPTANAAPDATSHAAPNAVVPVPAIEEPVAVAEAAAAAEQEAVEIEAEPVHKPRPRPEKQGRRPTSRR